MPPREIKLTDKYLLVPVRAFRDPGSKRPNKGNVVTVRVEGQVMYEFGVLLATKIIDDFAKKEFPRQKLSVFEREDGMLDLRIFLDRANIEVFAENGSVCFLEGSKQLGTPIGELKVSVEDGFATIHNWKTFRLKSGIRNHLS